MKTGLLESLMSAEAVLVALKEELAEPADPAWCFDAEKVMMLLRGLDLSTLLVRDAGRTLQGYPPASLDGAVQNFMEQLTRVSRQPKLQLTTAAVSPHRH